MKTTFFFLCKRKGKFPSFFYIQKQTSINSSDHQTWIDFSFNVKIWKVTVSFFFSWFNFKAKGFPWIFYKLWNLLKGKKERLFFLFDFGLAVSPFFYVIFIKIWKQKAKSVSTEVSDSLILNFKGKRKDIRQKKKLHMNIVMKRKLFSAKVF